MADNNKAYYYHFDGLGSVVALSNSNGDSCQSYEYSAYGQVPASDPNHPNPYMFTGRRFDIETGLYYYRARYYNPHIGRFMQTDPVGYGDGINWYLYCRNNPLKYVDPSGLGHLGPTSLHNPVAMLEVIASEGLGGAISIYGRWAIIEWVIQTAGTSIAVSGQMMMLLPGADPNYKGADPNFSPRLRSFEQIMDDEELFRLWAKRDKFPMDRPYNEYEALRIVQNFEKYFGEPPKIEGPQRDWEEHMHPPHKTKVHIPLTKEAYDLLKKLLF